MANILIVDDHPAVRVVFKTQLINVLGIAQVQEASNGHEAIAAIQASPPDLVILDLDLPKLNGLTLIPRFRQMHPGIRILVVSGQDAAVYAARAKSLGANGFINKTQSLEEILRGVEMVLAGYELFPGEAGLADARGNQADIERLRHLTDKEILVLQLLVKGLSNKMIGESLFISNKTVSSHTAAIMKQRRVGSLVDLVDFARNSHVAR
jgi:two-component system response regulator EvgA